MRRPLLLVGLLLFAALPSHASVGFDAKMTAGNGGTSSDTLQCSAATSCSGTPITVGASASCLVVLANWGNSPVTAASMTWNSVAMTQRASISNGTGTSQIYVLVSPASGAKTLSAAWTTSSDVYIGAVSFTGTDTTTCINTPDTVTGTSGTTVTVNTTANGATVATWVGSGATPATNFNLVWDDAALSPGGAGTYQLGGSGTNGHTFTGGGSVIAWSGVHVIAGAAGGAVTNLVLGGKAVAGGSVVANK